MSKNYKEVYDATRAALHGAPEQATVTFEAASRQVAGLRSEVALRHFTLAVEDGVRPGYQSIEAVVSLDSPASEQDLARLKETVDRHCPVLDIVRGATPVRLSLERAQQPQASNAAAE